MKNMMKINASILLSSDILLFCKIRLSFANKPKSNVANKQNGISLQTVDLVTNNGKIIEEIPRIKKILIILLPITLPIAIWVFPCALAKILTRSSGADVPNETIVKPMIKSDTFNLLAIDDAHLQGNLPL